MNATVTAEVPDGLAIQDSEREPELLLHLALPVGQIGSWCNDQHRSRPVTDDKLLNHKTGFNGLPKPRVVSNKQIDARHVNGTNEGVKLVILYGYAASERRKEIVPVNVCRDAPADGIQKSVKAAVLIMAFNLWQPGLFQYSSTWLYLPDYRYLLAVGILLNGLEGDSVLFSVSVAFWMIGLDIGDKPLSATNFDEFSLFGYAQEVIGNVYGSHFDTPLYLRT